jgi:uncharacterized membrane protein
LQRFGASEEREMQDIAKSVEHERERRRPNDRERERPEAKRSESKGSRVGWLGARLAGAGVVAWALLGKGTKPRGQRSKALTVAAAALAGTALLDTWLTVGRLRDSRTRNVAVGARVTIRRPADEIYRFWRDFRNLPTVMYRLDEVSETNGHSVWRVRAPAGVALEWEAEIVADRPGEYLAWRSQQGASIPNHGAIEFRPAPKDLGTEVHLTLEFAPPGGAVGARIARLFGSASEQALMNDLRRLKQLMETGEVVHSDASIHRGMHPARPPKADEMPLIKGMVTS